mgnify:CR=1 FL=1
MITLSILIVLALICALVGVLMGLFSLIGLLASLLVGVLVGALAGHIANRFMGTRPQHCAGYSGQLCGRVPVRPHRHPCHRQHQLLCYLGTGCLRLHLGG